MIDLLTSLPQFLLVDLRLEAASYGKQDRHKLCLFGTLAIGSPQIYRQNELGY